jgi:hypothetical protein
MHNVQLYSAIGVPTSTVLVGIVIGIFQSNHVLNQLNLRFTSLENRMQMLDGDMKTLVRASNELDVRLAHLEERLAR